MSKFLYLMRHGETLFNRRGMIQGACDSPLTEVGIQQAKIARSYFTDHKIQINRAYSSTQDRASDTLELITDIDYERLKGLKEWNFGIFEGESEDLNPKIKPEESSYGDYFVGFGGESSKEVQTRMKESLLEVMSEAKEDENVLVVSHGGAMFMFFQLWENIKSHPDLKFSNCCIIKYRFEEDQFVFEEMINHDFSQI